ALLGTALASESDKGRTGAATAAVAGVTALDVLAATGGSHVDEVTETEPERSAVEARSAITVNAPPEKVYAGWRDFEALPGFMYHLESVQVTADGCSHWVAKAPLGSKVEWDAEVVDDVPGERIAWRSAAGASVENSGTVRFQPAPGGRGTEIHVELRYQPPLGVVGAVVAKLFGEEPNQQLADDLRRFKQLLETGEVARSEGSPLGTRTQNQLHQEDAHPLEEKSA
ncbi:MAG: SRPBCC family protein, partial [Actinomycetota bacterium]|nr:SRPBCC family protein [Actinomycetota bacterium]